MDALFHALGVRMDGVFLGWGTYRISCWALGWGWICLRTGCVKFGLRVVSVTKVSRMSIPLFFML